MKKCLSILVFVLSTFNFTYAQTLPKPAHLVIIIEENRDYTEIVGNSLAPYINSLLADTNTALFTNTYGIVSGSQPNYLMLFSGSDQGVQGSTITSTQFTTCNLGASLIANGNTFIGYSEDLPSIGFLGTTSGNYARKHNPWSNWQGTSTNQIPPTTNMPFTAFPANFDSLPSVSFVVPNLVNDFHTPSGATGITPGDTWFHDKLDSYIKWAKTHNSMLMFTFDESSSSTVQHILFFIIGQGVKGGSYGESVDWYRMLRTVEGMYHLPYCGASNTSTAITSCWSSPTEITNNKMTPNTINAWPNPARGVLSVNLKSTLSGKADILIVDQLGRVAKKLPVNIVDGENVLNVDISGINAGVYFIRVSGEAINCYKKVIVED